VAADKYRSKVASLTVAAWIRTDAMFRRLD
jgi:hypothetical protein